MFDWIKNFRKSGAEVAPSLNNVYNLPAPKLVPPMPPVIPPAEEPKIFYRIGATDKARISFQMGNMEITMNREGCQHMIDQLTVFMDQLEDEE